MKSFLSSLGWIMFLALTVCFLLFYNFAYAPRAERIVRQQTEINMWIDQLQQMNDSVDRVRVKRDTAFIVSYSFDALFGGASDMRLASSAESLVQRCITTLQSSSGPIEVIGYSGGVLAPQALRDRYPGTWDYAAAAAGTVARRLAAWGVASYRIRVVAFSDVRPAAGAAGSATPRVDIVLGNQ